MSERKAYGATAQWLKAEIAAFPGRTAYELARALRNAGHYPHESSVRRVAATVSGILNRMAKSGAVRRVSEVPGDPWGYYPAEPRA